MGLLIPSRQAVVQALQSYVRSALPELDPSTSRRSFIGGLVKSLGSGLHDWYVGLKRYADNEPFPQTASRDFLFNGWWRDITKLDPLDAAPAAGRVVLTGTDGTIVDAGTEMTSGSSTYTLDISAAVVAQSLIISSLTRSGSTAIAETVEPHYLATGMTLSVSGATETDYNLSDIEITVTADNEFTYELAATPSSPATGTPIVSGTWGTGLITCAANGPGGNLDTGATLAIASPPTGLDSSALVTFGGIAGGSEVETTDSYRGRVLEALGTDFGMFSADEIKIVAKTVPGVTRVWVLEATQGGTNGVYEGQVRIAFMRDGDADPFPGSTEVAAVRDKILATILPAHTADEDVTVEAPTPLAVDFTFNTLVPSTASMRRAVIARLQQFFDEAAEYGTTITENEYICAIQSTYDSETRTPLRSFSLVAPTGAVTVAADELPILGDVTF